MGTEKSTGFGIFSLSGPREEPRPVRGAARHHAARAARHGRRHARPRQGAEVLDARAARSTPLFTAEHLDVPLDFESVGAAGSMLGTRALQIFDETVCVVRAVDRWTDFYKHESCGKCTPCREGTWWLKQILGRLEHGRGRARRTSTSSSTSATTSSAAAFCALGDGATSPITSCDPVLPRRVRRRTSRHGGCPFDPKASTLFAKDDEGQRARMTTTPSTHRAGGDAAPAPRRRPGHPDHRRPRRCRSPRAPWSSGPPSRSASRSRGSATTRCSTRSAPAASASSRSGAGSPGPTAAGRATQMQGPPPEAAGVVHDDRRPRAWSSRRSTPPRSPTRRSRASWSCCSSTTRSTARSATRAASAPCRTRR